MKNIKTIALIYALFTYCSACYGDIFKINRIGPEILEHLYGAEGLFRRMFPAQQAQDAGVQGLDAQGNAVHAQAAPEADFFFRKGSRIGFKGEFVQAVHGDQPVQGFHEVPQMRVRQHGGRPSSEVERGSLAAAAGRQSRGAEFRLPRQRTDEELHVCGSRRVLEKRTVRANAVAEGNVDVEMHGAENSASPAAAGRFLSFPLIVGEVQDVFGSLFHFPFDAGFLRTVNQGHVVFGQGAVEGVDFRFLLVLGLVLEAVRARVQHFLHPGDQLVLGKHHA